MKHHIKANTSAGIEPREMFFFNQGEILFKVKAFSIIDEILMLRLPRYQHGPSMFLHLLPYISVLHPREDMRFCLRVKAPIMEGHCEL
jgi:hypothetical protein